MDEMKLRIVSAKIESCVPIVTETWLDNNIPDAAAVELAGALSSLGGQDCSLRETQEVEDCFECTDWEVFKECTDLDGYTSSALSYLKFCTDAVLPKQRPSRFSLDSTVKPLLKACDAAYSQYQFAYRENRSTEDAVSIALHTALTHLQLPNTYVRMLFVDFSSAFNTVIPDKLILKLHNLGLPSSLCHWIRDFLTNRPQVVRIRGQHILYTGPEHRHTNKGCVLSPALFTLFTSKTKEVIVDYR
ncbi:hypothetical protein L3Q82_023112, partial [Scortum barcoo]